MSQTPLSYRSVFSQVLSTRVFTLVPLRQFICCLRQTQVAKRFHIGVASKTLLQAAKLPGLLFFYVSFATVLKIGLD